MTANDNDLENWHNWKRENDIRRTYREIEKSSDGFKTRNNLNCFRSKMQSTSQINGFTHSGRSLDRYDLKPRSSRSGPEVRFINPAIYAEALDDDDDDLEIQIKVNRKNGIVEHQKYDLPSVEASIGNSISQENLQGNLQTDLCLKDNISNAIGDHGNDYKIPETYRCSSMTSVTTFTTNPSVETLTLRSETVSSPKTSVRVERRCKIGDQPETYDNQNEQPEVQRYVMNGHRVVQVSTSRSSSCFSEYQKLDGPALARKLAHDEWIRKKELFLKQKKEEEERAEMKKRMGEEKLAQERKEKEQREKENFMKWSERKKKEEAERKAEIERQLELQKRLKEIEDNASAAKTLCLRQWIRKKEEEQKAHQKVQQIKQKQEEEEKKKRFEESSKAYEKWRESSKNRPKPATQGLLPHQKAKPAYVNPTPWQGVIEEESQEESTNSKKSKTKQVKSTERKSIASH